MNDLIFSKGNNPEDRTEEYESLLFRRDQLRKEASSIQLCYTKEFGELIVANFELKVECIKTKKLITACQRELNCGRKIDINAINEEIGAEMLAYYDELKDMIEDNNRAQNAKDVGDYRIRLSKQIYRRIAKVLHPDINAKTAENEALMSLWVRVERAYEMSDVEELEDLEALVNKVMQELGSEGFKLVIKDIGERIARVEKQISEILSTEPYIYKDLLRSVDKIAEKKEKLKKEKEEYEGYLKELKDVLNDILSKSGMGGVWLTEDIM